MKKPASTPAFRPLYEQIKGLLTQSLVAGEWKPGEAIPSEMELASRFQVSQGTVAQRLMKLNEDPKQVYPANDEGRAQMLADLNVHVTDMYMPYAMSDAR